jgi:CBS domain containing-hemolysin-like protein
MIWIVFALGLVVAVFGAVTGAALVSLSRLELTRAVAGQLRGRPGSLTWLSEMEQYIGVTGLLTALGVILLGAAIPGMFSDLSRLSLTLVLVLGGVPFAVLAAYLLPRWVARRRGDALRAILLPVVRPLSRGLAVLLPVRPLPGIGELRSLWRDGSAAGLGTDEELIRVGAVITFAERPVREVMSPRTELVAVSEQDRLQDIVQVLAQSGYSRLPVYRGNLDEIVGMLHAFDLFRLKPGDPLPIRPVAVAPASRACGDLLLDMQRERRHLAVVVDEYGGTAGIVTMEDLLEELVGEIYDEFESSPPAHSAGPTLFEADGATPIGAIEDRFELRLPHTGSSSVGGLLAELAGRIPVAGERFMMHGLEFEIVQASPTRIERILIRQGPAEPVVLAPGAAGPAS